MRYYSIVYEDNDILIVDKMQGVPTTFGKLANSLTEMVFNDMPYLKDVIGYNKNEGGLLNRLDNETGGLVLFAKNNESFSYFYSQMKNNRVTKIYTAIVDGLTKLHSGIVDTPIAHHPKNKKKMIIYQKGSKFGGTIQMAKTKYRLLESFLDRSLLEIEITKGVRHQIRVHLSSIGLPIVGDKLYNHKKYSDIPNHLLYSNRVIFYNRSGEKDR